MKFKKIMFSGHAVRRMFEREINKQSVLEVLRQGDIIAEYPEDTPFPSCLMLGFVENTPLHVVAALDDFEQTCYIITVYVPDSGLWDSSYKNRRTP